jgi:hypothetical protein
LRDHFLRAGESALRALKPAAVGKGIRRDVENAHNERPVQAKKTPQPVHNILLGQR